MIQQYTDHDRCYDILKIVYLEIDDVTNLVPDQWPFKPNPRTGHCCCGVRIYIGKYPGAYPEE